MSDARLAHVLGWRVMIVYLQWYYGSVLLTWPAESFSRVGWSNKSSVTGDDHSVLYFVLHGETWVSNVASESILSWRGDAQRQSSSWEHNRRSSRLFMSDIRLAHINGVEGVSESRFDDLRGRYRWPNSSWTWIVGDGTIPHAERRRDGLNQRRNVVMSLRCQMAFRLGIREMGGGKNRLKHVVSCQTKHSHIYQQKFISKFFPNRRL